MQQLSIIYDCFKAAYSDNQVSVPVVTNSRSEEYKFTVVGCCEGCNFILPAAYRFSGQQAAYELQKGLYTSKHQQNQAAAAAAVTALSPLIATTDLTLNFGKQQIMLIYALIVPAKVPRLCKSTQQTCAGTGVELFSAVFEPQADSAWLKCLILKFCLVAQSSLHEAGPSLSESESIVSLTSYQDQQSKASFKAKLQTPSRKMSSSNQKPLSRGKGSKAKQRQRQTSRAAAPVNRRSDSPKSTASTASQASKAEVSASTQSNRQRSKLSMAVPAASEKQASAGNGFSGQGALDTSSPEGVCAYDLNAV